MLQIELAKNENDLNQVFNIRKKVFTDEQGISSELDRDGEDINSEHILALLDNQPIGCGRIRYLDNKAKFERLAVLKEFRGKGYGGDILEMMIEHSKQNNCSEIYLDSQYPAKEFYENHGFKTSGKSFKEVGITHIKMRMEL